MNSEESTIDLAEAVRLRWPTLEDFYRERDDRTSRATPDLRDHVRRQIEIFIDPMFDDQRPIQQVALVASNLTARWARNIRVILPFHTRLASGLDRAGFAFLGDRILSEMRGADPFGNFELVDIAKYADSSTENLRLFIGPWDSLPNEILAPKGDDFVVASSGEYAIGRRGQPIQVARYAADFTPSAALAAAIGAADLFKRAIGHARANCISSFNWNLIDHSLRDEIGPSRLDQKTAGQDIGKLLLAGVGAIGSSLVYLLDLAEARGHVGLLDRDRVETSNLNRSLLFDISQVLANMRKTELSEFYLQRGYLSVGRHDGSWREMAASVSAERYDIWVSFTNEDGAWAQLPFQLPPVVIQGTTTSGWGFGAGRHIPRVEDCTLCRMPRPETKFRGPCAEGEIAQIVADEPVRAALPFLSAASAALALAEILKLEIPGVENLPNDISADLKTGLPAIVAVNRFSDLTCRGCRILRSDLWHERGGKGLYSSLSIVK